MSEQDPSYSAQQLPSEEEAAPMTHSPSPQSRAPAAQQGFTLIELVIVLVLLGILASVAIPQFTGLQEQTRASSIASVLGTANRANVTSCRVSNDTNCVTVTSSNIPWPDLATTHIDEPPEEIVDGAPADWGDLTVDWTDSNVSAWENGTAEITLNGSAAEFTLTATAN